MSVAMGKLHVELTLRGGDGASASFRSVFDVLEASRAARQHVAGSFPDLFSAEGGDFLLEIRPEAADLLVAKAIMGATGRAFELFVKPSERYLELVAAIASQGDARVDLELHGWPILSLGSGNPSVAEAGAVTSGSGGGAA